MRFPLRVRPGQTASLPNVLNETMKRLVINADDLGIAQGTNQAIARAHRDGILRSEEHTSELQSH